MEMLYFLCVDFMITFANFLGITYKDANLIILFGLIPTIILMDVIILIANKVKK